MVSRKLFILYLSFLAHGVLCEKCTNPVPFLKYFKYGYDLAEFDIFGCPQIGGKRAILSDQTMCSKGNKFKLDDEEKTEYQIPDEIFRVAHHPSFYASSGDLLTIFSRHFEEFIASNVFLDFNSRIKGINNYLFRKSEYYKEMRKLFDSNEKVGIVPWNAASIYSAPHPLTFYANLISSTFVSDANKLPSNYTGNEEKFNEFIKKYGTHYIYSARFGGILQRITTLKRNVPKPDDVFWEVRKDSFALGTDLKILCAKNNGSRRIEKVFDSNRNFQQIMLGGFADHKLFKNRSIPSNELKKYPALISAEMKPISELLRNENDKEKKESINKAIKIHLIRSTNEAYINIINDYKQQVTPRDKTNEVLEKYETTKSSYDEIVLTNLHNEIEKELRDISIKLRWN